MDLMVRYLDHYDYLVKTRYVASEFLGDARHNDLYQNFLSSPEGMDFWILAQVNYTLFMKTGTEDSGWEIKKTLKAAYTILPGSPASRDDYQSVTSPSKVPLAFCATRCIEDKPVAD